jgi:signal transduction histidine kinase
MKERVHLLGGELDIDSEPGSGTTVIAWVRLNGEEKS